MLLVVGWAAEGKSLTGQMTMLGVASTVGDCCPDDCI